MKKLMKILAVICALTLLAGMMSVSAMAEPKTGGELKFAIGGTYNDAG